MLPPNRPPRPASTVEQETAPDPAAIEPATEHEVVPASRHPSQTPVLSYTKAPLTRADLPVTIASILSLALPTLVEQMLSFAVRVTDTVVAAHTTSDPIKNTAAIAAVGTMTYLQWFAGLVAASLGVGATAIVARAIGARRPRLANRVAGTAMVTGLLVSLVAAILFYVFPHECVRLFGLTGLAEEYAVRYLRIMCFTIAFQTIAMLGNACLRGSGDTFRPMLTTITSTAITVTAVPILSFGLFGAPRMEIEGNALGTLLAFAASAIMTLAFLISGKAGLCLQRRHFRILPHVLSRILKIGLPSALESILLWGGQFLIVAIATRKTDHAMGIDGATLAGHQATLTIESLAFLPGFGFGIACSALVGQYLGAKKPQEAEHTVSLCKRLAVYTMTAAAIPMVFFPRLMLTSLTDVDARVITASIIPLILAGLAQPGFAVQIVNASALRGAGDTINPMLATMTGIILRIILVLILLYTFAAANHAAWGLTAVWIAIFMDLNYRALYNTIAFRRGHWKHQKV